LLEVDNLEYEAHTYKSGRKKGKTGKIVKGTFVRGKRRIWHTFWDEKDLAQLARVTGMPKLADETITQWVLRLSRTPDLLFEARVWLDGEYNRINFYYSKPGTRSGKSDE
jgi:hypothetical protein